MIKNEPEEFISETGEVTKLESIYRQISVEMDSNFDDKEEKDLYGSYIASAFDKKFLLIDSETLVKDVNILNQSFVKLIKHIHSEDPKFRDVAKLFIFYCDYFNIQYNQTYVGLSYKIQELIKTGYKKIIGEEKFKKIERRLIPNKPLTLFDLVQNKNEKL